MLPFTIASLIGVFVGSRLASTRDPSFLQKWFIGFLVVIADLHRRQLHRRPGPSGPDRASGVTGSDRTASYRCLSGGFDASRQRRVRTTTMNARDPHGSYSPADAASRTPTDRRRS